MKTKGLFMWASRKACNEFKINMVLSVEPALGNAIGMLLRKVYIMIPLIKSHFFINATCTEKMG